MPSLLFYFRSILGRRLTSAEMDQNNRSVESAYNEIVGVGASLTATANFKGTWSILTGPLTIPASVSHSGSYWMLLSNLADVTAATPGVSASWQLLPSGNVQGPGSAVDGRLALFDGVSGKLLKVASTLLSDLATLTGAETFTGKTISHSNNTLPTIREKLTAARTYYVRTDGSDSNTGLSNTSGAAFLTIQKAIDTAVALDLATFNVTLQVADGTYTGTNTLKPYVTGGGVITVRGNTTTPANVLISVTSNNGFFGSACGFWRLDGMKIQTTTSGRGVYLLGRTSSIDISNVNFGACAFEHVLLQGASARFLTNWAISGGASAHVNCTSGATFTAAALTCTLTGTPAITQFAACDQASVLVMQSITFSGSATGQRYNVSANGVIHTYGAGATALPGNSAGAAATGGQYI